MAVPWPFQSVTAPNFNTGGPGDTPGMTALTQSLALVPQLPALTTPVRIFQAFVLNTTGVQQTFRITDGSGVAVVPDTPIEPGEYKMLEDLRLLSMIGIQWKSSAASGVQGQIEGWI